MFMKGKKYVVVFFFIKVWKECILTNIFFQNLFSFACFYFLLHVECFAIFREELMFTILLIYYREK